MSGPIIQFDLTEFLDKASGWFLHSGIQNANGGVARYYRSDVQANAPISNEITGYAVSTLAYVHARTGDPACRDAAIRAGRYLTRQAWDPVSCTFPFEPGSALVYFFDIGIIVRGLLAAWRATGDAEFRDRAREAALALAFDFMGDGDFHPVLELPEKQPASHDQRWSRRPGCYQLKSALAWRDLGDEYASKLFESVLASSLATHESFLAGEPDREKRMDRLHAYCYFLEALLPVADREECRQALALGIACVAVALREIGPHFERSDVGAQLLRVRLIAHHLNAVLLDERAAAREAERASSFRAVSDDPRIDGGVWFGSRGGEMLPFVNPVSTAFCVQALALWDEHRKGAWRFELQDLI